MYAISKCQSNILKSAPIKSLLSECRSVFSIPVYLQLIAKDLMVCKIKGFSEVRKDCSNNFAPLELL